MCIQTSWVSFDFLTISTNQSIAQEFYFAHPETKINWTGSQLSKFGCDEIGKLESTYNKSVKIMLDLPWATHPYLIEPLTGLPHVRKILIKRFLSFISMVRKSNKSSIIQLLETIVKDVRFTTGSNLRTVMLQAEKNTIEELETTVLDVKYHEIGDAEVWRVDFIKEVIELKLGELYVQGFTAQEFEEILEVLCTQ